MTNRNGPTALPQERATLGAMLRDGARVAEVRAELDWPDFYLDAHQWVCRAVFEIADEGGVIDAVAVGERLVERGWAQHLGTIGEGYALLVELLDACPSPASAGHYARAVRKESVRRALGVRVGLLADACGDRRVPLEELQAEAARLAGDGPAPSGAPDVPQITHLSDVVPERVTWLWQGWMPDGCLVILDGDPGLGKSSMTLDLAARLSRGDALPPLSGRDLGRGPAATLLLGAEDSLKYTVRPRLDAMGADVKLIHALEGFSCADGHERLVVLPRDLDRVADFITTNGVKLVVVDPLMAFLGADTDAHKDQDVRRCLRPLSALADRLGVVVLLVRHLNKLSGGPALYRGGSSIGITGAGRASLIVGRDPAADRYVLAMNKINVGPNPPSLGYRIEGHGLACRIVWDSEPCDLWPDQILGHGPPRQGPGRPPDARTAAMTFLRDLLSCGPIQTAEMIRLAAEQGIPDSTLKRARADLGVQPFREGGVYYVRLVGQNPPFDVTDDEEDGSDD